MQASELRIGNLVNRVYDSPRDPKDLEEIVVGAINRITKTHLCVDDCIRSIEDLKAIPLTEEWLLRLNPDKLLFTKDKFGILIWVNGDKLYIKYVHQLQNIYFALTQKELIIKTK